MNYKVMTVWSCGSEKAIKRKIELVLLCILFILAIFVIIALFLHDIIFGCFMLLPAFASPIIIKYQFQQIKQNKLIVLILFDFEDFLKLGQVPKSTFVLFSSKTGVVLGLEEYKKESKFFTETEGVEYFFKFNDYYESDKPVFKAEAIEDPKEFLNQMSYIANNDYSIFNLKEEK